MVENCYFEQEKQKMNEYLPPNLRRILPYVQAECDRYEYSGSPMFDEYPDALMLDSMCSRIYERLMEQEPSLFEEPAAEEVSGLYDSSVFATSRRRRPPRRDGSPVRDVIWGLLGNECFSRRCRDHCDRCRDHVRWR